MKIIKQVDISNWAYKHTCADCETEMEADKSDINYQYVAGDRNEIGSDRFHFACPVCSKIVYIPNDKIPKALQIRIKAENNNRSGKNGF
jgi:endogenous inhibitor of DNA gyrase (YacG/DUF329 family)